MIFSDDLMFALNDWQKGWKEDQFKREKLSKKLLAATKGLDDDFKKVASVCYRKRFLHKGELVDIILKDEKKEGVVSWTINQEFAERFKELAKDGAVSGAIFEHQPTDEEVIVNICELWKIQHLFKQQKTLRKGIQKNLRRYFTSKMSKERLF